MTGSGNAEAMVTRKTKKPITAARPAIAAGEGSSSVPGAFPENSRGCYPEARISLDFSTPWQCLVATILSAQCTDERVNQLTPELFRQLPDIPGWRPRPKSRLRVDRAERLLRQPVPCRRLRGRFWSASAARSPIAWKIS